MINEKTRKEAMKFGYCDLFATPERLADHIDRFATAFHKTDKITYLTAIHGVVNYFAVQIAKTTIIK